jgi:hypothetical protein
MATLIAAKMLNALSNHVILIFGDFIGEQEMK